MGLVHAQLWLGPGNGDATCTELFHEPQMHAFNGMMTAVVQSTDESGQIVLEVSSKGLKSASLPIVSE